MKITKLTPACKSYLWGGKKLKNEYGKRSDSDTISETWELSFLKSGLTMTEDGVPLAEVATAAELGENVARFENFPVLIKFIDAKRDLSIQVHPSDVYALKNEGSYGKTEMWYIVEAFDDAGLYLGFERTVTKDEVRAAITDGTLDKLLKFKPVKAGQFFVIPAGTVHAICKGCVLLEVQQSSELTYRLYDYNRRDKDGNLRQLHVDKALDVAKLETYAQPTRRGALLANNKYFTVKKFVGARTMKTDGKTFLCVSCVCGEGAIDGKPMKKGDSFFVPANYGAFNISGEVTFVTTEVRRYFIGVDIGGTFIKAGVMSDDGNVLVKDKIKTDGRKRARVISDIVTLCDSLLKRVGLDRCDIDGVGVGVPGLLDGDAGVVKYSNNLKWRFFPLAKQLEDAIGIKVKIANDADVATLGEYLYGAGKNTLNCVMITLGTGVGSGVIANGRLYTGNKSAGAEIGHMTLVSDGIECTCGRKGCFEAYCSAPALVKRAAEAMLENRNSALWSYADADNIKCEHIFAAALTDETAKKVVNEYIAALSVGLVNISNIFRPEKIIIGGGVSAQKSVITKPLQTAVDESTFGGKLSPRCQVVTAKLGNDAGFIGAAALAATM